MAFSARDIMQSHVITVSPEDLLNSVQRLFADEGIHGAPVVNESGRVMGVISSSDLLRAVADDRDGARPEPGYFENGIVSVPDWFDEETQTELGAYRVGDAMTESVVSVAPDASVRDVANALCHNQVHRALVIADEKLLGIISSFDLIEFFSKESVL